MVRSDNGAEYTSEKFEKFYKEFGVHHQLKEKRSKLDNRSQPRIFAGYSSAKKGYRIYNYFTKKVIISRDVKFDERKI
ncbi:Integrase, catalytic core [Gossypium australe]|uniref:Integrase, catalytic core n=1 Tax=Gossypium australe TaxID=47621 RepID=A0A5B6X5R9_9ROSI|nr:Integrase, catalytic core [Gossypium australe]